MALTLVTPSERHRLRAIEMFTRQPLVCATLPSPAAVEAQRDARFKRCLDAILAESNLNRELMLVQELAADTDADVLRIAAAAIRLARAPEQRRPLTAVRDLSTSPGRTPPRRHQPGERTGGQTARFGERRRRPRSSAAVSATEG
jgi:ATP-dependent RNA helicase DeaD